MRILLLAAAAAVTLAGGAAATLAISDDSLALAGSTTTTSSAVAPAGASEDVSGPCDEAEHARAARCAGTAPASTPTGSEPSRRTDGAGRRHHQRHRGSGSDRSGSGHGADDTSGHGGGGDDGHGGGSDGGHGGHGRDHAEDD
jgi:hypothetical protein